MVCHRKTAKFIKKKPVSDLSMIIDGGSSGKSG
jgi:hypothetical protein